MPSKGIGVILAHDLASRMAAGTRLAERHQRGPGSLPPDELIPGRDVFVKVLEDSTKDLDGQYPAAFYFREANNAGGSNKWVSSYLCYAEPINEDDVLTPGRIYAGRVVGPAVKNTSDIYPLVSVEGEVGTGTGGGGTGGGDCLTAAAGWKKSECLTMTVPAGAGVCSNVQEQEVRANYDEVLTAWVGSPDIVTEKGNFTPLYDWPSDSRCCPRMRLRPPGGDGTTDVTMRYAGCVGGGVAFKSDDPALCDSPDDSATVYSICFTGFTGGGVSLNVGMVAFEPVGGSPGNWTGTLEGVGDADLVQTGSGPTATWVLTVHAAGGDVMFTGTGDGVGPFPLACQSGLDTAPAADLIAVPSVRECQDNGLTVIVTCGCGAVTVPCCPKPIPRTLCLTVLEWRGGNAVVGGVAQPWVGPNYTFRNILFAGRRVTLVYQESDVTGTGDGVTFGTPLPGPVWYGEFAYSFGQVLCSGPPTVSGRRFFALRCEQSGAAYVWRLYDNSDETGGGWTLRYEFSACVGCDPFALISDRITAAGQSGLLSPVLPAWVRVAVGPPGCPPQDCAFKYPGTTVDRGAVGTNQVSPVRVCAGNIVDGQESTLEWFPPRLGDYAPAGGGPPNAGETVTAAWSVPVGGDPTITFTLASGATLTLTGSAAGVDGTDCDWKWTFRSTVVTSGGTAALANWACYPFAAVISGVTVRDGGGVAVDDPDNLWQNPLTGFSHSSFTAAVTTPCDPDDTHHPPAASYNCVYGTCVDPGDGTGEHATLDECVAAGCGGSDEGGGPAGCGGVVAGDTASLAVPDGPAAGAYTATWALDAGGSLFASFSLPSPIGTVVVHCGSGSGWFVSGGAGGTTFSGSVDNGPPVVVSFAGGQFGATGDVTVTT